MSDRTRGFLWIGTSYLGAYLLGFILYFMACSAGFSEVLALFFLDLAATVAVWLFGLLFRNASFYDPYWSATPHIMLLLLMAHKVLWSTANIIFLLVFSLWSIRLTVNWAQTFSSINTEDWRYQMYRTQQPKMWQIINFFGIHLMPTLLVFAGLLPALIMINASASFYPLQLIGEGIMLFGVLLELSSDNTMHRHLESRDRAEVCQDGLWKYSRHPNYLGEISFWFGIWVAAIAVDSGNWRLFPGFLFIFCLFAFISIPMMEKRQLLRRKGYRAYREQTSMLFLWKPKKQD